MMDIFYFDKTLKKGKIEDLPKLKSKKLWIDINHLTRKEADIIKDVFDLHPLTVEDMLHYPTRIKVEEFKKYLFCIFYGVHYNKKIEPFEIDFVLGGSFIISNHKKEIPSYNFLKNDKERLEKLFARGCDFIFHKLLDMELSSYLPVLDYLDEEILGVEEEVIQKSTPDVMKKILDIKRMITLIKKSVVPQREKISFLAKNEYPFISRKVVPYFRDLYDHSIRIADIADNHKESITNTYEVYMSTVSNKMSEVMKVLSIIATIALPLTVISSIYGTNFRVLPGSQTAYGFWGMVFVMCMVCATMLLYFRSKKWI